MDPLLQLLLIELERGIRLGVGTEARFVEIRLVENSRVSKGTLTPFLHSRCCQNPLTGELNSGKVIFRLHLTVDCFIIVSFIMSYIPPSILPSASVVTAVSMSVAANAHNGILRENEQQKAQKVTIISGCLAGASGTPRNLSI